MGGLRSLKQERRLSRLNLLSIGSEGHAFFAAPVAISLLFLSLPPPVVRGLLFGRACHGGAVGDLLVFLWAAVGLWRPFFSTPPASRSLANPSDEFF